ncbi:flagellar hook-length control protein FliK [Aquibacillus albus]|uniref:Flagellar hook-length control protein FliK n=1 Tax=Aquibacillus albus TaxID=1168171 RepID=A0ABS2N111_9BACI|nr:flagellar hook-length control protein FliK [Aquibacillus albus]MBM7571824.1 flagellar hook-length control protein FliK [Aquibacillus albus]
MNGISFASNIPMNASIQVSPKQELKHQSFSDLMGNITHLAKLQLAGLNPEQLVGNDEEIELNGIKEMEELHQSIPEELATSLSGSNLFKMLESFGEEIPNIDGEKQLSINHFDGKVSSMSGSLVPLLVGPIHEENQAVILKDQEKQLKNLWGKVQELLQQVVQQGTFDAAVSHKSQRNLLRLLEQWTDLEKQIGKQSSQQIIASMSAKQGESDLAIWEKLVQTYQKRDQMVHQQKYQSSSMVSTTDISKWLKDVLHKHNEGTPTGGQTASDNQFSSMSIVKNNDNHFPGMPVSNVEQLAIHLNRSASNNQSVDESEFLQRLQQAIKSSKFLHGPNGANQLLLKLKPEHLGDIMVKLVQENGEMVVKMTVSSHMTKDLLEANINQLRHMFSPQQVLIEKQELPSFQQDESQLKKDDHQKSSDQSNSDHNDEELEQRQEKENQSEESFYHILMNEEV